MKKKRICFKSCITFISFIVFFQNDAIGQQSYNIEKVVPPSPTAAALGAYGDVPVSYYTGQANISIPLYQIKTSQHELGIDLSYNSNIRVNQDASWVGLGWSLNAGGVITRSVRGNDDFDNNIGIAQGYYYAPPLPQPDYNPEDDPMDTSIYKTLEVNDGYKHISANVLNPEAKYIQDALEGRIDTEPDIFYYNFAGYSGSFVIGKQADGSIIFQKNAKDELKIEIDLNNTDFGSWTITTPEGYIYHFATVETSENLYSTVNLMESQLMGLGPYTGSNQSVDPSSQWSGTAAFKKNMYDKQYATSWYLSYIEAPNAERITFNYVNHYGNTLSNINISQTRYDKIQELYLAPSTVEYDNNGNEICRIIPNNYSNIITKNQATRQIIHNVFLESINFENGRIQFEMDSRKDIEKYQGGNGAQKLSKIKIYSGNKSIKNFLLEHDYFNTSFQNSGGNLPYTMCRLKLNKVYESGKPPHVFEYHDSNSLPSKYSKLVDDWGFYNPNITTKFIGDVYWSNQNQATTSLPEVNYNGITYPGKTSKPDETGLFSRCGILQKIKYPTQGYTIFDYEPNRIKLFVPELIESQETVAFAKNGGNFDVEADKLEDIFSVNTGNYQLTFHAYPTYADPPISPDVPIAWLKNSQGAIIETFYLTNPNSTVTTKNISLSSGTYKLEVLHIMDHEINLVLGKTTTSNKYYKTVGGLRIAKITNHNPNNDITSLKKILYTENGLLTGNSTGGLLENIVKHEITEQEKYHQIFCPVYSPFLWGMWQMETKALFLKRSTNGLYPLGFNSPNGIVGYHTVYELSDETGQIGKTKYEYRRTLPKTYNSNHYGNFLSLGDVTDITKYDASGKTVNKAVSSYVTKNLKYLYGINPSRFSYLDNPCLLCPLDQESGYPIPYYLDYSEWYVVDQVVTKEYDENSVVSLENTEKFNYEDAIHKQISSKSIFTSKGEEIKTIFSYPYNNLSNNIYQQMVNNHVFSPTIKEENFIKVNENASFEFLQGKIINYENLGGKLFRPTSIISQKKDTPIDLRVEYSYDLKGNIIKAKKENGAPSYFVWGYKKQYPIAKIENFDPDTDMTQNIENLIASIQNYSDLDTSNCTDQENCNEKSLRSQLNVLRNALPAKCMINSYTYDPLVGMTSMTDPKGYTVYYKYDSQSRLKYIKDGDGNVISENKYRYKN